MKLCNPFEWYAIEYLTSLLYFNFLVLSSLFTVILKQLKNTTHIYYF